MLYDITVFGHTMNLDDFITPDQQVGRFLLTTALRCCQDNVDGCLIARIDTDNSESLSDLAHRCLFRFSDKVYEEKTADTWCEYSYAYGCATHIYGGKAGLHACTDNTALSSVIAYIFDEYLLYGCNRETVVIGCLLIWALGKVYDLDMHSLSDAFRARNLTRKDILGTDLPQKMLNRMEDMTIVIDEETVHMPPVGTICLHTCALLTEVAAYMA